LEQAGFVDPNDQNARGLFNAAFGGIPSAQAAFDAGPASQRIAATSRAADSLLAGIVDSLTKGNKMNDVVDQLQSELGDTLAQTGKFFAEEIGDAVARSVRGSINTALGKKSANNAGKNSQMN